MTQVPTDALVLQHMEGDLLGLGQPVHVAVTSGRDRRASPLKRCHLMTPPLPIGGFVHASPDLYVASPELTLAQMAGKLDFANLLTLAYCLCGRYVSLAGHDGGLRMAYPVTSVTLASAFMRRNPHVKGSAKALCALAYVRDGSASPMEAALVVILCLPCRYGGFGMPFPLVNKAIVPGESRRVSVGQSWYECDLLWPKAKLAVEYDGEAYHTGIDRIAHDAARRNDLEHLGYGVITVTKRQLYHADELTKVATQIARQLGVQLRHRRVRDWQGRHSDLRRALLGTGPRAEELRLE